MSFASQNEEKTYKKWLKESPFGTAASRLFENITVSEEKAIEIFQQEKARTKAKEFLPFEVVFKETFIDKLPEELSEEQEKFLATLNWAFILNKIEAMNKVLEKAYNLFDEGKSSQSLEMIKHLADAGHPEACYLFAAHALQGPLENRKHDIAFHYGQKALLYTHHPRASLIMAGLYYVGMGAEHNPQKAISYVLQAERTAETDPSVYAILSEYYQDGYIVNRDVEKVAHYAHRAEKFEY